MSKTRPDKTTDIVRNFQFVHFIIAASSFYFLYSFPSIVLRDHLDRFSCLLHFSYFVNTSATPSTGCTSSGKCIAQITLSNIMPSKYNTHSTPFCSRDKQDKWKTTILGIFQMRTSINKI